MSLGEIEEIIEWYFDWLCHFVDFDMSTEYEHVFAHLYNRNFRYSMEMDGNRAEDGINLRYQFGRQYDIPDSMIAECLDNRDCSILEMMVALAIRCETAIAHDEEIGNRTYLWFWNMLCSLRLDLQTDNCYVAKRVDDILDRFLDRKYDRDGKGSLFWIPGCKEDMRQIDIWYQMMKFMREIMQEGD